MTLSADAWLANKYPDATCGGTGRLAIGPIPNQLCPDCNGSGLDDRQIEADKARGLIPAWVLQQGTKF